MGLHLLGKHMALVMALHMMTATIAALLLGLQSCICLGANRVPSQLLCGVPGVYTPRSCVGLQLLGQTVALGVALFMVTVAS